MITVAVEAMGGDFGPLVTLPACQRMLADHPDLNLIILGTKEGLDPYISDFNSPDVASRVEFRFCQEVILDNDTAAVALRHKPDSSMRKAIELVKSGEADACVSSGNTAALMAISRNLLSTHVGIDRPAIVTQIPAMERHPWMLDLGANVDCSSDNLVQFALMGIALAEVNGIESPKVALLNVGQEQNKGSEEVRLAHRLLAEMEGINFAGYIEGEGIFKGQADVIVCDGFVGNVALKTTEGIVEFVSYRLKQEINRSLATRALGWIIKPIIKKMAARFDPQDRNGAILIGLQGIVVKSHGKANETGFMAAINLAKKEAEYKLNDRIAEKLDALI